MPNFNREAPPQMQQQLPRITTTYGTVNPPRPWMQQQAAPAQTPQIQSPMAGSFGRNGEGLLSMESNPYFRSSEGSVMGESGGNLYFRSPESAPQSVGNASVTQSTMPSVNLNAQMPQWYYPYYSMLGNLNKKLVG